MTKYAVNITKQAQKQLMKLPSVTKERVAEQIYKLGQNPDSPSLDIKPLNNDTDATLRLRVGNYRVKFNRDDEIYIIEIIKVGHRKDIYK